MTGASGGATVPPTMTGADQLPRSPSAGAELAAFVDHTLLRADARPTEFDRLCDEAREHGFAAVCVPSGHVARCASRLLGTPVRIAAVVGFPLGSSLTSAKVFEAQAAVRDGAREIDMVLQVGSLKARDLSFVERDIRAVVDAVAACAVKVILETAMLDDEEKALGASLAKRAGAAFVKTCTGYGGGRATVEDVRLLRSVVGDACGVKASGGIRDAATARALIDAGATRLGTSSGLALVGGSVSEARY